MSCTVLPFCRPIEQYYTVNLTDHWETNERNLIFQVRDVPVELSITGTHSLQSPSPAVIKSQSMCMTGNFLLVRCCLGFCTFYNLYEIPNGEIDRTLFIKQCNHLPPVKCLASIEGDGVVEYCPTCKQIWFFKPMAEERGKVVTNCEELRLRVLCNGPKDKLLGITHVSDGHRLVEIDLDSLKEGELYYDTITITNLREVLDMEYFPSSDTIVLAKRFQLQAYNFTMHALLWKRNDIGGIPLTPKSISSSYPEKWLCVANGINVLLVEASDGSLRHKISMDDVCGALWFEKNLVTKHAEGEIAVNEISGSE